MVSPGGTDLPIVTVTGISGFIGSRIGLAFAEDGGFRVRGTVRDPNNAKKVQPLKDAYGAYFNKVQLVAADLLNEELIDKAIAGSTYVAHVASPL